MRSAVTVSLVPEARGGPFVFWDDLEAAASSAAMLGFDAIEIFPHSAEQLAGLPVRSILQRHGLQLAAVGTGAGWVVQRLRLTDPDPEIRARAIAFVSNMIDQAGALGAPTIVGSMQGRAEQAVTREQALDWLAEACDQLAPRAERFHVSLFLEPLNRYETNLLVRITDGLAFLDRLKSRNVKLLCDLFHMNIEEADMAAALRLAAADVGHVHFADSNRHAVGYGHTNIPPIVDALKQIHYRGFLSAEVLPKPSSESAAKQTIESFQKYCRGENS